MVEEEDKKIQAKVISKVVPVVEIQKEDSPVEANAQLEIIRRTGKRVANEFHDKRKVMEKRAVVFDTDKDHE